MTSPVSYFFQNQWYWVVPSDDHSKIPLVHGPFMSEVEATRDAMMLTKRFVSVPEDTVKFACGLIETIAEDWLRNHEYYAQQKQTDENQNRANIAKNNHAELRRHIDELKISMGARHVESKPRRTRGAIT